MNAERTVIRGVKIKQDKNTNQGGSKELPIETISLDSRHIKGVPVATKGCNMAVPAIVSKRRSKTLGKHILATVLVLQLIFIAVLSVLMVDDQMPYVQAKHKNLSIKEKVITETPANEEPVPEEGQAAWNGDPFTRQIDWASLTAMNPDIKAWIWIPGTHIDYPVLQGHDNQQYLNRALDGSYSELGSLFLQAKTDETFSDTQNIIFGHNMVGKQMFGGLSDYGTHFFSTSYPGVWIYTPEKMMHYTVFGAYSAPIDDPVYTSIDTETMEGVSTYRGLLTHVQDSTLWHTDLDVTSGLDAWEQHLVGIEQPDTTNHETEMPNKPRMLTLSTCTDDGASEWRFVVNFVLTEIR